MEIFAFIVNQILFYCAIALTLFVSGFLLLQNLMRGKLNIYELTLFSIPVSFTITTFSLLGTSYAGLPLTAKSIFAIIIITILALLCFLLIAFHKNITEEKGLRRFWLFLIHTKTHNTNTQHSKMILLGLLLVLLMFVIKGSYMINTVFPTSTDLGHHMFWVERIIESGDVPIYEKSIILPDDPKSATSSPAQNIGVQKIPDFIIGEHIIFGAIALLSSTSVISSMPILILFFVHIVTIFALTLFSYKLFKNHAQNKQIALWTFIFIGPLYAISGAQAKFATGGVVGNILGNMLIVTSLYFLYRALSEKNKNAFILFFITTLALLFTHHLSMFILGYVIAFCALLFIALNAKSITKYVYDWYKIIINPAVLIVIITSILFIFFIHTPSYLDSDTISGSVGSPEKSTRVGLPLAQLTDMSGHIRFLFGMIGFILIIVLFLRQKKFIQRMCEENTLLAKLSHVKNTNKLNTYACAFLIGWLCVLLIMTLDPALLKVNILSTRIATYIVFPLAILAGYAMVYILTNLSNNKSTKTLPITLTTFFSAFLFFLVFITGIKDSNTSLKKVPEVEQAVQTFHSARYLTSTLPTNTWALKDHNYIEADTWMKVFTASINPDYTHPLSRGFFARYESKPEREHCTREMISEPSSALAQICFKNLSVSDIVVHTEQDAGQFLKDGNFYRIYQNNELSIFRRK